jgi:hypothetical protein
MPDAADATVIDAFERAGRIMFDPLKADAFKALCSKGASGFADISGDLTHELYGFMCGVLNVLAMTGNAASGALLDAMQAPGVRGDLTKMRSAIKTAFDALATG